MGLFIDSELKLFCKVKLYYRLVLIASQQNIYFFSKTIHKTAFKLLL